MSVTYGWSGRPCDIGTIGRKADADARGAPAQPPVALVCGDIAMLPTGVHGGNRENAAGAQQRAPRTGLGSGARGVHRRGRLPPRVAPCRVGRSAVRAGDADGAVRAAQA